MNIKDPTFILCSQNQRVIQCKDPELEKKIEEIIERRKFNNFRKRLKKLNFKTYGSVVNLVTCGALQ